MNVVTEGLMEIYQRLLGLKFNKLTGGGEVWHEDVELFQVDDATAGENLGKQIRTKAVKSFPRTTTKVTSSVAEPVELKLYLRIRSQSYLFDLAFTVLKSDWMNKNDVLHH